jgi:hypothetical protein
MRRRGWGRSVGARGEGRKLSAKLKFEQSLAKAAAARAARLGEARGACLKPVSAGERVGRTEPAEGALLLNHPEKLENPFFLLYPRWAVLALATAATIIASQAIITGAAGRGPRRLLSG